MFCAEADLQTESDVEQKLLWPLITADFPRGFGFSPAEVLTKANIKRLKIDKGNAAKLYYPDYLIILSGLPTLVIEAKSPNEDPEAGLREARLYAAELNAMLPSGVNPCQHVISCNGKRLLASAWDSNDLVVDLKFSEITVASERFAELTDLLNRKTVADRLARLRGTNNNQPLQKALSLIGGQSVRNEQLGTNTFGATLSLEYGHLFNPTTKEDRAFIVKHAYVPSKRRDRYIEPIDRLIRGITLPAVKDIQTLSDSGTPTELVAALSNRASVENKLILLIGSVGSGKSTFIDYLTEVALPRELVDRTVWIRINLNNAPLSPNLAYDWITDHISTQLRDQRPDLDFEELETVEKLYWPEIRAFKKGPLNLLDANSIEYKTRLADKIIELQKDRVRTAQSLARYVCGNANKLLVVCLDNCDKRSREEQLLTFQLAQWIQKEFRCVIFLPLRDITYDLHKHEPPLDTALKTLTFRIEPPRFSDVLARRVHLAIDAMLKNPTAKALEYTLPNGMRVSYPSSDQGVYLASILRSLYAYDKFVRQIMSGLAGRDMRKAMEIFLDFCTSGHIGEDQIYKMRALEGQYTLPFKIVARVLLRMHRRFYEGDKSYLKNLFQCDPTVARRTISFGFQSSGGWSGIQKQRARAALRGFIQYARLSSILAWLATTPIESERKPNIYFVNGASLQSTCESMRWPTRTW